MVDETEAMDGQYLTVEDVKNSPTKKLVIVGGGEYAQTDYGTRFVLDINIDNKKKTWRPNRDCVKNLSGSWGRESNLWIGKTALLSVVTMSGRDTILAVPEIVGMSQEGNYTSPEERVFDKEESN